MIQVNLLPAEMRKPEGTPMTRFLIIIGDVVVVCAAIFAFFFLRMIQLPAAEKEHTDMASEVALAKKKADKYDKLEKGKQSFEQRKKTFEQLSGERVVWAQKLAQLSRIVADQPAWLADLKVTPGKGPRGGSVNKITSVVWTAGRDLRKMTAFRRSLRADEDYWSSFQRMGDLGNQLATMKFARTEGDRTRVYKEEKFYTFTLEQHMHEVGAPEAPQPVRK